MPEPTTDRPAPDQDPLLTVAEVGERLKVHPATVRVWIRGKQLAAFRVGREWRVRRSEVDRIAMSNPSQPAGSDASAPNAPTEASSPSSFESAESAQPEAPRRMADHIMAVGVRPGEGP